MDYANRPLAALNREITRRGYFNRDNRSAPPNYFLPLSSAEIDFNFLAIQRGGIIRTFSHRQLNIGIFLCNYAPRILNSIPGYFSRTAFASCIDRSVLVPDYTVQRGRKRGKDIKCV